jgi:hypothetical protein
MRRKAAIAIGLFCLLPCFAVYSQDCKECQTRRIILYDNEVTVPRPLADVDSIYRFWDYFFIAGGVRDYLRSQDPTRDCIYRLDGAFFTTKDSVTKKIKYGAEHANLPPPGETTGFTDYILYGQVSGSASQTVTIKLETGKTREVVKSVSATLPKGFDPFVVGRALGASLGPIYSTMMEFERKKRDQGDPYAIVPKATFTPAKAKINVNEKTTIEVLLLDCDGVALKNRKLTLEVTGGTTQPSSTVTTDEQGKATIEFTAGSVATLATVTTDGAYRRPTGDMSTGQVQAAYIQINKPNDSWYLHAVLSVANDYTSEYTSSSETGSYVSHDETTISMCAWLKSISPGVGGGGGYFVAAPLSAEIHQKGLYGESSFDHRHMEYPNVGFTDRTNEYVVNALSGTTTTPTLVLNIGFDSYTFSINQITAVQTGSDKSAERKSDPFNGLTSTTNSTPVSPTRPMSFAVQGKNRDTVIVANETTTNPSSGLTTTTSSTITQAALWKNQTWTLNSKTTNSEVSTTRSIYTQVDTWNQLKTARIILTYTGDPITAIETRSAISPAAFALHQNYPNPFNPTTTILYAIPVSSHTTITISDVLGRKVSTLVDRKETAGMHLVQWNAVGLPSGVYFLQMKSGEFVQTRKLLLAK